MKSVSDIFNELLHRANDDVSIDVNYKIVSHTHSQVTNETIHEIVRSMLAILAKKYS